MAATILEQGAAQREGPHTVIRHLPISLAVAALFTLPRVAFAQAAAPPPMPAPVPAPAPAPVAPPPAPAPVIAPPMLAPVEPAPPPVVVVTPPAPAPAPAYSAELMTLKLMKEKGVLSKPEYESALKDLQDTGGIDHTPLENSVVMGKWATTLYGFVEADNIWDSTRAFNDAAGAAQIPRGNSQAGQNGRFTMAIRNSRLGFRLKAPEVERRPRERGDRDRLPRHAAPRREPDPVGHSGQPRGHGERVLHEPHPARPPRLPEGRDAGGRHPRGPVLGRSSAGSPTYQPNTVEIQGVPGSSTREPRNFASARRSRPLRSRSTSRLRRSRPAQRDSATPGRRGRHQVHVDSWTGLHDERPDGDEHRAVLHRGFGPLSAMSPSISFRTRRSSRTT